MATQEAHLQEAVRAGAAAEPTAAPIVREGPRGEHAGARLAVRFLAWALPRVGRLGIIRRPIVNSFVNKLRGGAERGIAAGSRPPGVIRDRTAMGVSMIKVIDRGLSRAGIGRPSLDRFLNTLIGDSFVTAGLPAAKEKFRQKYGCRPPGFLLISPTKTCNLRCTGCYADSGPTAEKLEWPVLTRIIREARELWGLVFIVLSGGEPLAYKDGGKTVLDLAEENGDTYFMMYTNGTLINEEAARRMGRLGNIIPAISVEGLRGPTDKRRGSGVFDKVVAAMDRLRREKVIFGVSLTATRDNADELLSDEVIDFYFEKMGALYGWLFHYMPMGRSFTLDLLPTPEQRLSLWRRSWHLVYDRQIFFADFWNSGTASNGCVSSGHPGGYLTIDWNGKVAPCVFVPYSPVNIREAYAQGRNLNDVWAHPFFAELREWQWDYSNELGYHPGDRHGNWTMPCPIRDHYAEFFKLLKTHNPEPVDENARAAMDDPEYYRGMVAYNQEVARIFEPIWEKKYMRGEN